MSSVNSRDTTNAASRVVAYAAGSEIIALVLGLVLILVGITGVVARVYMRRPSKITAGMMLLGVLGLILVPVSIALAFVVGDGVNFIKNAALYPLATIKSAFGQSEDYSSVCFGNKCVDYCCQNLLDTTDVWRDCNKDCTSKFKTVGRLLSEDCRYKSGIVSYCDGAQKSQSAILTTDVCNYDPNQGPVTCKCCHGDGMYWWDCNQDCSSLGTYEDSYGVPNQFCADLYTLKCVKDSTRRDTSSNQSTGIATSQR